MITLSEDDRGIEYIEAKIRGPRQSSQYCFYFFEQVIDTITQAIYRICPGLLVERHILSPQQLRIHNPEPYCYSPEILMSAMLEAESTLDVMLLNGDTEKQESIMQLVLFGNKYYYFKLLKKYNVAVYFQAVEDDFHQLNLF